MFAAMEYQPGSLRLIDQRLLPAASIWLDCRDLESVAQAIEDMVVRGAPAIGCTAAFALAIDARDAVSTVPTWGAYRARFAAGVERLRRTRPTAVNLFYALDKITTCTQAWAADHPMTEAAKSIESQALSLFADDLRTCMAIGAHGAALAGDRRLRILTHCNTGSLATAGYGTALGVIRALHAQGKVESVYADETRPYLQGARLTAYELEAEGIPYQVIVDAAAAYLMQQGKVDWVIAGADRIAANGDTANKIGTYGLAVQCRHHGVEFYIAAPRTTFDGALAHGGQIPVEERDALELRQSYGKPITPPQAPVYNPAFDVTPHALITGIITEHGVLRPPYAEAIAAMLAI